jgi:hypothetical protein
VVYETTLTASIIRTPIIDPEQLRGGTRRGRKPVIPHHMTLKSISLETGIYHCAILVG